MPDPSQSVPLRNIRGDVSTATARESRTLIRITAAGVYPVAGPPIRDGALLIDEQGRIAEVGGRTAVPSPEHAQRVDLPRAIVLPGLVNAHTHLELTGLAGHVDDDDFPQWIGHVRREKEVRSPQHFVESARRGLLDAWAHGITTVADTGDSGAVVAALTELGGRGIVYQEVFGPDPTVAEDAVGGLRRRVEALIERAGPHVSVGVSPHAPYSVSAPLYRLATAYAREMDLPVAVHIAESDAEWRLVTEGAGPFAVAWRRRGIAAMPPQRSPVALLSELGVLGPRVLAIHAVRVDRADMDLLARTGSSVVLCPRSNTRHHHGLPPVSLFLGSGVPVAVGTDSLASVESIDVRADARVLASQAGCDAAKAVRVMTVEGARALGLQDVGTLEPGAWADLCALQWPGPTGPPESWAQRILSSAASDVVRTYVAGRCVFETARAAV